VQQHLVPLILPAGPLSTNTLPLPAPPPPPSLLLPLLPLLLPDQVLSKSMDSGLSPEKVELATVTRDDATGKVRPRRHEHSSGLGPRTGGATCCQWWVGDGCRRLYSLTAPGPLQHLQVLSKQGQLHALTPSAAGSGLA
jgi:hypothetical protein